MNQDGGYEEATVLARRQAFSTITLSSATARASSSRPTSNTRTSGISSSGTFTASQATITHSPAPMSILDGTLDFPNSYCTVALPAGGIIKFNDTFAISLGETISFQGPCENNTILSDSGSSSGNSTVIKYGDPFYASIAPQTYALATATIVSYLLVIILFITPRTFYVGGPAGSSAPSGGSSGLWGRGRTFMSIGGSNSSMMSVGRRPLLQKIATITVAVSLTIATAHTFTVAERQYHSGIMDSSALVYEVVASLEIRIIRVISDAFLWLAQVQTLIRLFPRHKEKVTIKWLGFAMVICDTVFSILENFVSHSNRTRPASFTDAIPALSYLFELSISLIYASCVIYYALSKRRFAFWHSKMRNMCILALLSICSVMVPVVFFIVDVAEPDIATWGEYIRWVGAAAASVVVWEWVERIEAVERDEKKDGILGREIFDGDEMLDMSASDHGTSGGVRFGSSRSKGDKSEKSRVWKNIRDLNLKPQLNFGLGQRKDQKTSEKQEGGNERKGSTIINSILRPEPVASPINRGDTNSASTTYAVKYHNPLSPSPAIPEDSAVVDHEPDAEATVEGTSDESTLTNTTNGDLPGSKRTSQVGSEKDSGGISQNWHAALNPFKRKRAEPPAEVAAQITESNIRRSPAERSKDVRRRFNAFASSQKQRFVSRSQPKTPLQVTIIPAQSRKSQVKQSTDDIENREIATGTEQIAEGGNISTAATSRRDSMAITFIPAPTRGGRTWSPDEMHGSKAFPSASKEDVGRPSGDSQSTSSPQEQAFPAPARQVTASSACSAEQLGNTTQYYMAGPSTTPNRRPYANGRSIHGPTPPPQFRSAGRNRGETMTSISDRLSTSPVTLMSSPSPPAQSRIFNSAVQPSNGSNLRQRFSPPPTASSGPLTSSTPIRIATMTPNHNHNQVSTNQPHESRSPVQQTERQEPRQSTDDNG